MVIKILYITNLSLSLQRESSYRSEDDGVHELDDVVVDDDNNVDAHGGPLPLVDPSHQRSKYNHYSFLCIEPSQE